MVERPSDARAVIEREGSDNLVLRYSSSRGWRLGSLVRAACWSVACLVPYLVWRGHIFRQPIAIAVLWAFGLAAIIRWLSVWFGRGRVVVTHKEFVLRRSGVAFSRERRIPTERVRAIVKTKPGP